MYARLTFGMCHLYFHNLLKVREGFRLMDKDHKTPTPTNQPGHKNNDKSPVHANHENDVKPAVHVKVDDGVTSPHHETERSETRNLLIGIGVVLAIVLIFFATVKLFPSFSSAPQTIDDLHKANLDGKVDSDVGLVYNGFSFVKQDGLWWGVVSRQDTTTHIRLHYNPKEIEDIKISGSLNASFNNGPVVYQAINPDVANKYYTLALTELNSNVVQGINRRVVAACTRADDICENRTIAACNSTQGLPVIELIPDDVPRVELRGSCIGIYGRDLDLVRAAERVLYQWYGVMQ